MFSICPSIRLSVRPSVRSLQTYEHVILKTNENQNGFGAN